MCLVETCQLVYLKFQREVNKARPTKVQKVLAKPSTQAHHLPRLPPHLLRLPIQSHLLPSHGGPPRLARDRLARDRLAAASPSTAAGVGDAGYGRILPRPPARAASPVRAQP